jgi:aminoglycoside phosphotransferase (APT) family kinase protein
LLDPFGLHDGGVLADELLDVLRAQIGVDQLDYAEAPVRLSGGFFTENHSFRLTGATTPWEGPLVVRLFPSQMRPENVRCEVEMQRAVSSQHYPAPRVLTFDERGRLLGRQFLVMERLPGMALMGAIDIGTVLRRGPRLLTGLARTTAEMQAALHALDPAPAIAALDGTTITLERWFELLRLRIEAGADGFAEGLRWLVDNRPAERERQVICHGDLWAGNILVEGGKVSGVLDWSVATLAEPAFDIGFTTMSLSLAPIDASRPIQRLVARLGRGIARRYVHAYQQIAPIDLNAHPYYEALRCAAELSGVAAYRLAGSTPTSHDQPPPNWATITDTMVKYFRHRTGVELRLPTPDAD